MSDYYFKLKYMGYCMAKMPPTEDLELRDFIRYVKFQLAAKWNVSVKDPIFDKYNHEFELIVEYYAHLYNANDEAARKLEKKVMGDFVSVEHDDVDDFIKMAEEEMAENAEELKRYRAQQAEQSENAKIEDEDDDEWSFRPGD